MTTPSEPDAAAFSANSNCSFHQWAYQTFLWLTSPAPGGKDGELVFEGFANPDALFVPGGPTGPYPGGSDGPHVLARFGKSRNSADPVDIFQAGPGNKGLYDQAGNIVYYVNHLDQTYWDFVVDNKLFDLEVLKSIDPTLDFTVGSLELKSSWRIAKLDGKDVIPDAAKRFFTLDAVVPSVAPNPDTGVLEEHKDKPLNVTLALVGMHVTGVVNGHPEFIWATFEHIDNAPTCADAPQANTHGGWNFNDGQATADASNQFNVGDPTAVVNVCQFNPNGTGATNDQDQLDNQNAIVTLNNNVQRLIADNTPDSLWSNYRLIGAEWTNGSIPLNNGSFAPEDTKGTQLGSLLLANTSMETFTQNDNCFSCHNGGAHEFVVGEQSTQVGAKHINLSHFVVSYQATQQVKNP